MSNSSEPRNINSLNSQRTLLVDESSDLDDTY